MSQNNILLESGTNELEIIEFFIEETTEDGSVYSGFYGMNVAKVLEIIRKPVVTNMPSRHHTAALGTFNLRGRIMPLVDLSLWLGKNMVQSENNKVIVSEFSGVVTAFLVSGVNRIHRLNWNQVEAPSRYVQHFSLESITGIVRRDNNIIFILDMEKIIGSMNPQLDMSTMTEIAEEAKVPLLDDASNFHIMIADDSPSIRNMIGLTLEKAGYKVSKTASGKEAWEFLLNWKREAELKKESVEKGLHAIISDIEMPEMDGHALTKKIKEDPALKKLPVVLFSSLITETMRQKGLSVGADDQISKPDLPRLTLKMREIISEKLGI